MRVMHAGLIVNAMRIEECGTSIYPVKAASRCSIEDVAATKIAIARWTIVDGLVGEL